MKTNPWCQMSIQAVVALLLALNIHLAQASIFSLGSLGTLVGIEPGSKLAKPYAVLDEDVFVTSVAWSPDGKYIADMGIHAPYVHIWDVGAKKLVHTIAINGQPSSGNHSLSWSPDGRYLAVCSNSKSEFVSIWDTHNWQAVTKLAAAYEHGGECISPVFSSDDLYLAVVNDYGDTFVYSTESWQLVKQTEFKRSFETKINSSRFGGQQLAFLPGSDVLAIAVEGLFSDQNSPASIKSNDFKESSRVIFYDLTQSPPDLVRPLPGQIVEVFAPGQRVYNPSYPGSPPSYEQAVVKSLAFSPNGRQFATGSVKSTVRIWDTRSRRLLHSLFEGVTGQAGILSLAYTGDGKYLIVCRDGFGANGEVGMVYFLDAKTYAIVDAFQVSNYGALAYSDKAHAIAVGGDLKKLLVWKIC